MTIVVDNASVDNTFEFLKKKGIVNDISVTFIRLEENKGGAGGFYHGMAKAQAMGFDWMWLMDDDGLPEADSLKELYEKRDSAEMLNALVIGTENPEKLVFGLAGRETTSEALQMAKEGLIYHHVNPFNGTFISGKTVSTIGLPKKEMFIWGDELEYLNRVKQAGLRVATAVHARHLHPVRPPSQFVTIRNGRIKLFLHPDPLRHYCHIRNMVYIRKTYSPARLFKTLGLYSWFYISNGKITDYLLFLRASFHGLFNRWGHERDYL